MKQRGPAARAAAVICAMAAGTWAVVSAQGPGTVPIVGKSIRYCNPLSIETSSRDGSPQGVHLGDVTVVREGGKYYLFGTGGGGWVSGDLVTWRYEGVVMRQGRVPVAPHVVKYNGQFYMSGNDAPLYRAPSVLGPYEIVGDQDGLRTDAGKLHDIFDQYGLANGFEIYPGPHTSRVADRFQNHVMGFFSRTLSFDAPRR